MRHTEPYDLCDTLEAENPGVEYKDTTPLEIRIENRWYQRAKMALTYHIDPSLMILRSALTFLVAATLAWGLLI